MIRDAVLGHFDIEDCHAEVQTVEHEESGADGPRSFWGGRDEDESRRRGRTGDHPIGVTDSSLVGRHGSSRRQLRILLNLLKGAVAVCAGQARLTNAIARLSIAPCVPFMMPSICVELPLEGLSTERWLRSGHFVSDWIRGSQLSGEL